MKNILVALAPAIAVAVLGLIVEVGPKLKMWAIAAMHSRAKVESLKELMAHSAFYGSFLGGLMGYKKETAETYILAAAWLVVFLVITFRLARRLDEMEEFEETRLHRKMAGTLRSIVRSEVERAASSKKGGEKT